MKIILFRNVLFSVVISVIPALLPVIALRNCNCSPSQLGFIFACVGVGSLTGAMFVLPYLRERLSTNAIISTAMAIMIVVLYLNVGHPPSACFDDIDRICWRGLGARGFRTLGGWATCNARMGARTDERVPDNARSGRHGAGSNSLGDRCGKRRPRSHFRGCGCGSSRRSGHRASLFDQLRHGSPMSMRPRSITRWIWPSFLITTMVRSP